MGKKYPLGNGTAVNHVNVGSKIKATPEEIAQALRMMRSTGPTNTGQIRKVKVGSVNNGAFFYDKYPGSEKYDDYRKMMALFLSHDVLWLYMLRTRSYQTNDEFFELTPEKYHDIDRKFIDSKAVDFLSMVNQIRANYTESTCVSWKLVSDNYIGYFYLDKSEKGARFIDDQSNEGIEVGGKTLTELMFYKFDLKKRILTCIRYILDPNDPTYLIPSINPNAATPLYAGKEMDIDKHLNSAPYFTSMDRVVNIKTMYDALTVLCEHTDFMNNPDEGLNERPSYTNFEMKIFNKFVNLSDDDRTKALEVCQFGKPAYEESLRHLTRLEFGNDVPRLDLSQKEFNFIRKYASKTSIFSGEKKVNFYATIKNQRWGEDFIIAARSIFEDEVVELMMTYEYEEKEDILTVSLGIDRPDRYIGISASFNNIKKFEFSDSLMIMKVFVILNPEGTVSLPNSVDAYESMVPPCLVDKTFLFGMMMDIVSIYLVLHERPERTKMIRETKRVNTPTNGSKKSKNKKSEPEYVVKRILKPTKEAKEYIANMSSESGGIRRDAEYTMEWWPRRGYERRLPGKEEKIWVDETTCHRHKQLTTKEVHLKL